MTREKTRRMLLAMTSLAVLACTQFSRPHESPREPEDPDTGATLPTQVPYLILVSLDGYRFDFTEKFRPPFLRKMQNQGCLRARALLPVYPSKTFPNHWSIITGMYADKHGIVGNSFIDVKSGKQFSLSSPEAKKAHWFKGEPFWVTARKYGVKTASYFWPGSDVKDASRRPDYFRVFDKKVSHSKRTGQIIEWLTLAEHLRPRFLTLYFADIDSAGHSYGPDSPEVKKAVLDVDQSLQKLWQKLQQLPVEVNLIVVSDHGMEDVSKSKYIYLSDFIGDLEGVRVVGSGAFTRIYAPVSRIREDLYKRLQKDKNIFRVYRREEVPPRYHYSSDPNIGDLILETDPPYYFLQDRGRKNTLRGNHGFNPFRTKSMSGIFYACGPQITGGMLPEFRSVHIYPFLAELFGFPVSENVDGDGNMLKPYLRKSGSAPLN